MRKKRAVVYDDDPVMRSALTRILERRGYEVVASPEPEICRSTRTIRGATQGFPARISCLRTIVCRG